MKLFVVVFGVAILAAAKGKRFQLKDCILMDVDAVVTVTAESSSGQKLSVPLNISAVRNTISGNCSGEKSSSVSMTVAFNKTMDWILLFTTDGDQVRLDQVVRFHPNGLFNSDNLTSELVGLSDTGDMFLSLKNESFSCTAEQKISFNTHKSDNYTFGVSEVLRNLKVQAFGLKNNSYSTAEDCAADKKTSDVTTKVTTEVTKVTTEATTKVTTEATTKVTTEATTKVTTEATTAVVPTLPPVKPVAAVEFTVTDGKGNVCFRLEAGLQIVVEYNTTNNTMAMSKLIPINNITNVTGTCSNGTSPAIMVIYSGGITLQINETRTKDTASSAINLTVVLDPTNFPGAAEATNKSEQFDMAASFQQSNVTTFYLCKSEQTLQFNKSRTTLFTNDVKLQAFGLKNGSFSGDGVECSLDPSTTVAPTTTTTTTPGDNTYVVHDGNVTCIVLKGDITFSNITYTKVDNTTGTVNGISIPAMNQTGADVTGSCSLQGGKAQELKITFNGNWTLTLTFTLGTDSVSSMLGATKDEYSLHDIVFVYNLKKEFFPNASRPDAYVTVKHENISGDFLKGSAHGGSYKCNAKLTETIENGVVFETTNLQYKAFNDDNSTSFSGNNVSECSDDNESNSIVPIAVGAALAGLVVMVLIAYLIGRRRSRRQGYESV